MIIDKTKRDTMLFIDDMITIKEAIKKENLASRKNRELACMLIDGMILSARAKLNNNKNNTNYVF